MKDTRIIPARDDHAEVGIGTMQIFIAMVLVAAASAGVVLETSGDLSEQAEITAGEAIPGVSTGFWINGIMGDRRHHDPEMGDRPTIQYLEITLKLRAGSQAMALNDTLIEITDGDTFLSLTLHPECDGRVGSDPSEEKLLRTGPSHFSAIALMDRDGSFGPSDTNTSHVVGYGDIIRVHVNCSVLSLCENSQARIWIIPRYGIPTVELLVSPSTFLDRYIPL